MIKSEIEKKKSSARARGSLSSARAGDSCAREGCGYIDDCHSVLIARSERAGRGGSVTASAESVPGPATEVRKIQPSVYAATRSYAAQQRGNSNAFAKIKAKLQGAK